MVVVGGVGIHKPDELFFWNVSGPFLSEFMACNSDKISATNMPNVLKCCKREICYAAVVQLVIFSLKKMGAR